MSYHLVTCVCCVNSVPKCYDLVISLVTKSISLFLVQVIKSLNSHQSVQTEWVGEGKLFHSNVGRYKVKVALPDHDVTDSNAFASFLCHF